MTIPDFLCSGPALWRALFFATLGTAILGYFFAKSSSGENSAFEIDWATFRRDYLPYGKVCALPISSHVTFIIQAYIQKIVVHPNGDYALIYMNQNIPGPHIRKMNIGEVDAFHEQIVEAQNEIGVEIWERVPVTYSYPGYGRSTSLPSSPIIASHLTSVSL